jgi:type IV pilus assembly protein PilP
MAVESAGGATMNLAFLVLSACSHGPAPSPAATPLATPAAAAVATAPAATEDWSYNPIGKRDPYRSFVQVEPPRPDTCPGRLCWPLEQLTLTGIVWGEHPQALVEDPEGQGHLLGLNDYVGSNWGRITSIASDAVVVTEEYLDPDQRLVTVQIRMELDPRG